MHAPYHEKRRMHVKSMTRKRALVVLLILVAATVFSEGVYSLDTSPTHRVLIYGDSNTYGWTPVASFPSHRYPATERWPGVLQQLLGSDVEVIEEGLPGRTTDIADVGTPPPFMTNEGFSGAACLPAILGSHVPVDVVVIMLGTNDVKAVYNRSAYRTALGAGILIDIVNNSAGGIAVDTPVPKVLLLAPPPLGDDLATSPWAGAMYEPGGLEKSSELAPLYALVAEAGGAEFLDLGQYIETDGVDEVHFTRATHAVVARVVAEKLEEMLK
jgi:lysophospholipase L1-like esterase